jgi:hypothetical protein
MASPRPAGRLTARIPGRGLRLSERQASLYDTAPQQRPDSATECQRIILRFG